MEKKRESATQKLSTLLGGHEKVQEILRCYKIVSDHTKNEAFGKEFIKRADDFKKYLTQLKRQGDLTEQGKTNVYNSFLENLKVYNEPDKMASILLEFYLKRKRGNLRNRAVDLVLYMIVGHFKLIQNTVLDYTLIADFLSDKGIVDGITTEAIKKRCNRFEKINPTEISLLIDIFKLLGIMVKKMEHPERVNAFLEIIKENL
jgi:hypothetical protein